MSRNGAGAAASRREEGLETIPGDVLVRTDLRRLDLSGNALRRLDGLESLSLLSTLNVSRNQLSSKALQPLLNAARELVVLNAGHNRIKKLPDLTACAGLKALLLNRNSLRLVRALPNLKVCTGSPMGAVFGVCTRMIQLLPLSCAGAQHSGALPQ